MGFSWVKHGMRTLDADSVVAGTASGISFGTVLFTALLSSLLHVRELPEFMRLVSCDRSMWPRSLLFHGWLPWLSTAGVRDPWAAYLGQLAHRYLERLSGMLPTSDPTDLALGLEDQDHPIGGFEVAGAGVFLLASEEAMRGALWSTTEEYGDACLERCRVFMPVPGPLQTVQRAEFWSAFLALQAFWPGHLGFDNLNVVRSVGRLLDQGFPSKPLPLVKDGDLISLVQQMIRVRGPETVQVSKVRACH